MSNENRAHDKAFQNIIDEEEKILSRVKSTLNRFSKSVQKTDYANELIALRDALTEERLDDDRAMIMDQMDRIAALSQKAGQSSSAADIDSDNPYFAHLGYLDEKHKQKDVLIGKKTFIEGEVRIVDWRNAPISRVFYHWREEDQFDEEMAGRIKSGTINKRRTITILEGDLKRISCPSGTFIKANKEWIDISGKESNLSGGAGSSKRPDTSRSILGSTIDDIRGDKHLAEISALLDKEQFDLITKPGSGMVVIRGTAGSGKTTVALHRIAYLNFHSPNRYRPRNMAIIVFSKALARYVANVLPALGVNNVSVYTLGHWANFMKKKHFPKVTRLYSDGAPSPVLRFKTHSMMIPALAFAAEKHPNIKPEVLFDELFTDKSWIKQCVNRYCPNEFTETEMETIHRYCTDQQFFRDDNGGPNEDDIPCYDEEDDMILLRLYQLLKGRLFHSHQRVVAYDHLMIDEAQDFSPLELLVLMETVKNNSITLAGDRAQKITEHNDFSDWGSVLEAINRKHTTLETLKISYRSTKQILKVAQHVLGHLAINEVIDAPRSGAPVELFRCGGMGEAMTFLAQSLEDLMEREPRAGVAILTRYPHQAEEAYQALKNMDLQHLSRVRDQDFSFRPGIEVTDIAQTKGLEFDYVILLNTDLATYPDNDISRHLLHVGITRAIYQLWMISWQPVSRILPDWLTPTIAG